MTVTCAHPTCERPNPYRNAIHGAGSRYCTLHDGKDHGPVICLCPVAHADEVGQCTRCWRPITSLHPLTGPPIDQVIR